MGPRFQVSLPTSQSHAAAWIFTSFLDMFILWSLKSTQNLMLCRKEYKRLHTLRRFLPDVPFVGLTATATEKWVLSYVVVVLFFGQEYSMLTKSYG